MAQPNVLIIGGGIIGSTTAYYLAKGGATVTVVDKGEIGYGCSYGNAGWIVPAHAMPLPAPGVMWQGLKWMFNPESPLYIKPRLSSALMGWLWRFSRAANSRDFDKGAMALMPLARHTLELYKQFAADHPRENIHLNHRGLLHACRTPEALEHIQHEAELSERLGMKHQTMTGDELRQFEPALHGQLAGGVYLPDEGDSEPLATVKGFARAAGELGAVLRPNTEVYEFERQGGRITGVRTTAGVLTADQYVLASGSWSAQWARTLGLAIPIQAGKGYAIIVDPIDPMPRGPISLTETKVAITPREGSLRLSGTMEIAGLNESITGRRVEAIMRGARAFLNVPERPVVREIWRGLRPCTPDGLPMIGRPGKWENLTIAAGHAMLGLTLGSGTGRLVADLIGGKEPLVDPAPFSPDRFGHRRSASHAPQEPVKTGHSEETASRLVQTE